MPEFPKFEFPDIGAFFAKLFSMLPPLPFLPQPDKPKSFELDIVIDNIELDIVKGVDDALPVINIHYRIKNKTNILIPNLKYEITFSYNNVELATVPEIIVSLESESYSKKFETGWLVLADKKKQSLFDAGFYSDEVEINIDAIFNNDVPFTTMKHNTPNIVREFITFADWFVLCTAYGYAGERNNIILKEYYSRYYMGFINKIPITLDSFKFYIELHGKDLDIINVEKVSNRYYKDYGWHDGQWKQNEEGVVYFCHFKIRSQTKEKEIYKFVENNKDLNPTININGMVYTNIINIPISYSVTLDTHHIYDVYDRPRGYPQSVLLGQEFGTQQILSHNERYNKEFVKSNDEKYRKGKFWES